MPRVWNCWPIARAIEKTPAAATPAALVTMINMITVAPATMKDHAVFQK